MAISTSTKHINSPSLITGGLGWVFPLGGVGGFIILFFALAYPHHLHYQEQLQMFLFDSAYVWDIIKLPGGVADLLGRFCTQFFLYAWVGAAIIALLLSAILLLTLRLANWGMLYGLSFIPAFLLWMFLLDENALLGGVWAVIITLCASWFYDKLQNGWVRKIVLLAFIPLLYWMAGPICILFFLLHFPYLNKKTPNTAHPQKHTIPLSGEGQWGEAIAFLFLAVMILALSHFLPIPANKLWTGIHYHRYPTVFPTLLWAAVLSIFALKLLTRILHRWTTAQCKWIVTLCSFALVAVGMGALIWKNANFKAEKSMQYDFMACHQQWNRILNTISKEKPNNQIGVTVQNLALSMRGMLGDHMFEYNQNGIAGLLPDVERDATSPLPTAEAFYQLGMINAAQHAVFEAQEAILDFQKSARCYKRLAETNLINGNYEVARRYLTTLQKTLFYSDWADNTLSLLGNENAITKHPEYGHLRQLSYKEDFFISDHLTPNILHSLLTSNSKNRMAYEYLMAEYLLTGDLEGFVNNVALGEKAGYTTIPRHLQEAFLLYWGMNHKKNEQLPVQIDESVVQRFSQLRSYMSSPTANNEGLAQYFGDTYWYYYFTRMK